LRSTDQDLAAPRPRRGHGRATLRDVAAAAGVTAITVSRYLRQPAIVAPETAALVRQALASTGYVPNKQAGVLASGRGGIVAALVPNLAQSIFAETLQGLSRPLEAAGLELLVAASGYDIAREESQIRALLGWAPRALVITGRHHTPGALKLLREAHAGGCTVIEMWDQHASGRQGFAQVGFNHRAAGATMAQHLLQRGQRRLAYVDSAVAGDYRARERGDGFVAAAQRAGATVERRVAPVGEPIAAGRALIETLRSSDGCSIAVAFANDHLACGALLGAQAAGRMVPQELALIGFGDFELAAHLAPGLTTMAPPRRAIGERTAELLLAPADPSGAAARVRLDGPLVIRGSTRIS
jgi:LacI family gluconate utilization system Gnt-I transcriptional repressor